MKIRSYVVRFDAGFAPNPFGGYLTLATCKPRIRKYAEKGDLIVGTGSAQSVGSDRLTFAAIVSQVVPIADYGTLDEFAEKRPCANGKPWMKYGDNYYFLKDGEWKQRLNFHHGIEAMSKDLSGENVLVCNRFWYYGEKAISIPIKFAEVIKVGPGHKIIGSDDPLASEFLAWLNKKPVGIHGRPVLAMNDVQPSSPSCDPKADHC